MSNQFLGLPSLLLKLVQVIPSQGLKRLGCHIYHSPPPSAKVMNEWSCTCVLPGYLNCVDFTKQSDRQSVGFRSQLFKSATLACQSADAPQMAKLSVLAFPSSCNIVTRWPVSHFADDQSPPPTVVCNYSIYILFLH